VFIHIAEALAWRPRRPFAIATYTALFAGLVSFGTFGGDKWVALFVGTLFCGWCEITNPCGQSHLGSITPHWKLGRAKWVRVASAYTIAGVAGAALAGLGTGFAGHAIGFLALPTEVLLNGSGVVGCLLLARELGRVRFPVFCANRQTQKMWAFEFGYVPGAAMWGAHIGLAYSTVFQRTGFYLIVLLSLVLGPTVAAGLFVAYWLGRTLPIWLAPVLVHEPGDGGVVVSEVGEHDRSFDILAAVGIGFLAVSCFSFARMTLP
jgi:hypothetical protein